MPIAGNYLIPAITRDRKDEVAMLLEESTWDAWNRGGATSDSTAPSGKTQQVASLMAAG